VEENSSEAILTATEELLRELIYANRLEPDDVVSILFSATPDLDAAYPATAVRRMEGWELVPLFGTTELAVSGGLSRVVRVLFHAYTSLASGLITHVYLREATSLRPDLAGLSGRNLGDCG
jgi:chorismate mutase